MNVAMIKGDEVARLEPKQTARMCAIISNTKQTESEMRSKFAEALQALAISA